MSSSISKPEARRHTKKIGLREIRTALKDSRFRESLPPTMKTDLTKYLQNPTCNCNLDFLLQLLRTCRPQLAQYFPGKEVSTEEEEMSYLPKNNFSVINCGVDDLEKQLRALPPGRKQLAVCRYLDQVTVIINELDLGD